MNWPVTTVGDVCVATTQVDPARLGRSLFRYLDISSIDRSTKSVVKADVVPIDQAPSRARKLIEKSDVLVSTVRPNLNTIAMVPEEFDGEIASTGFCVLRANRKLISEKFLYYWAQSSRFVDFLVANATGAHYPAVSDGIVKRAPILLPPLSEQRRITNLLDEANGLRRLQRDAGAKAARVLPSLFLKMFGDPASNPMRWPTSRLDALAQARLGKMLDAKRQSGQNRRPYLRNLNVQWDCLELDDLLEMDFLPGERKELQLQPGDLLVCEGGEVGRAAIWRGEVAECYFQKALHRVRPIAEKTTAPFLLFWLRAMAERGRLVPSGVKATIPHLTGVQLAGLEVVCPERHLVKQFTDHYEAMHHLIKKIGDAEKKIDSLYLLLLQRAFSGELTTSWRVDHMDELVVEIQQQASILNRPRQSETAV